MEYINKLRNYFTATESNISNNMNNEGVQYQIHVLKIKYKNKAVDVRLMN